MVRSQTSVLQETRRLSQVAVTSDGSGSESIAFPVADRFSSVCLHSTPETPISPLSYTSGVLGVEGSLIIAKE
jgi:hypothetical protein